MSVRLVIVGAGGFGRESLDVAEAMNSASTMDIFDIVGVLDDNPSEINLQRLADRGVAHLGTVADWFTSSVSGSFVVAIGDPAIRERLSDQFTEAGAAAATLIHPSAGMGSNSAVGSGSVVCAGVQVSTNVAVGNHVHLNPNATIGHDTVIHDFVSVNPAAVLSGDLVVEESVLVGAGAVILQGLIIGHNAIVGAGACVVKNVAPNTTVKGVPAR